MKLALVLGAQGEKLKPRLENIKDSLDIDCFVSVPSFIDSSIKRELIYDRVVVLSTLINDVALKDLKNFWSSKCNDTDIIFLCREGQDTELAKVILNQFLSTKVATMLVKNTTIQILSEAILLTPKSLTDKYGIEKYMAVEVDSAGELEFQDPTMQKEPVKVEQPKPEKPVKQQKKGLFSGLFGGKKSKKVIEKPVEEVEEQNSVAPVTMEEPQTIEEVEEPEIPVDDSEEDEVFIQDEEIPVTEENEKTDINMEKSIPTGTKVVTTEVNEFEPDSVNEDYGDLTFSAPDSSPMIFGSMTGVSEVDEEGDSLADAEEQYRSQNPSQKVVVKTVNKYIGDSIDSNLKGLLTGRLHKTIIVTGDRGSGVTTTAYLLAKKFAEDVPVLYFDCDIDRHGILSYIDYETFRAYDRSMTEGVKRCRDASFFSNCVVQYDTNLDILTSDYSCDAEDNDISKAHAVVAENVMNYGVVVVDCPVNKLHLIPDLVLTGNTVVCMECSKRGVMNMLCGLEGSPLELRYKRCIHSRGHLLVTKLSKRIKSQRVIDYADTIFADSGCNWLSMRKIDFDGSLNTDILGKLVEG